MLKRIFLVTFASILLLFSGVNVFAQTLQEGLSHGPSTRPFGSTDDTIIDDELISYDAQLWAPYDITRLNGEPERHSGFYSELGFAYTSLSGPAAVPGADPRDFEAINNWSWARDFEVGYVTEGGTGWSLSWLDLEGTVFLRDSEFVFDDVSGGFANPSVLRTTFDRVAARRQFRQSLSTGGWIEPYIGLEYLSLNDFQHEDRIGRFSQRTRNNAFGGSVGSKYFRQYGRFTVGGDVGIGAFYNDQTYAATTILAIAPGGFGTTFTNRDNDFIPLVDFGVSIRYAITRDISLRAGAEISYAWQGIARVDTRSVVNNPYFSATGGTLPTTPQIVNDEDLVAAGFSFGIDWRR